MAITLIFDFPDAGTGRPVRTVYREPVQLVEAWTVDAVGRAVAEVERAVDGGMHAAGFIAYEAAPAFEPRMRVRSGNRVPLLWFGLFDAPTTLPAPPDGAVPGGAPGVAADLAASPVPSAGLALSADWRLEMDRDAYNAAVAAVREAIAEGLTYQVNLTARMRAELDSGITADPASLYNALRRAQGSGWHAMLDLGDRAIVSVSPELFFRTSGRRIETRPMKGTRARGRWPAEDRALAEALAVSEKDRAENLMIVDLLRNDLGRVCQTGSVRATRLFDVERYPTVWQMTSSVEGRLRPGVGLAGALAALFPCGSVTGAPKISTMDQIAALEMSPREVYCGAIGLVRPGGDATFNVPIRTLWWDRPAGVAEYGTGGGIVWDSTAASEYDELLAKAVVVREPWPEFDLLETMATVDGQIPRLDRHLHRLAASAAYFGFACPVDDIRSDLADTADRADRRVRLTLAADGAYTIQDEPLGRTGHDRPPPADRSTSTPSPVPVALAGRPVRATDRFLFHKTTHRANYDAARDPDPDTFDTLLWNEAGEATEFTRGNLVIQIEGQRVTPPLSSGLLPGCLRGELIDRGEVAEAPVTVEDVQGAERVWFINSARGWIEVVVRVPHPV